MLVVLVPHPGICQGLISEPQKVLDKISSMTGGTATFWSDDQSVTVTVAEPDMSLMTLTEIRDKFASSAIYPWKAMRVVD